MTTPDPLPVGVTRPRGVVPDTTTSTTEGPTSVYIAPAELPGLGELVAEGWSLRASGVLLRAAGAAFDVSSKAAEAPASAPPTMPVLNARANSSRSGVCRWDGCCSFAGETGGEGGAGSKPEL